MKSRFNLEEKSKILDNRVLYAKDIFVSFKNKEVLKGVTIDLRQGETLALVGANGAGKTVLMETILGLLKKEKGEVYLNLGHKTFSDNLKEVGIQFQSSKFGQKDKVYKIINFFKKLYKDRINDEDVEEMIDVFDIREFYKKKISKLSGGQKQRVNLMIAIIHNPKLMILDEFITGLDVKSVRKIITYVNKLKIINDASMIIISHQPEEIKELADRVIVLNDGKIISETTVEEIEYNYGTVALFLEETI